MAETGVKQSQVEKRSTYIEKRIKILNLERFKWKGT
jgi:hypothetical protein